MVTSESVSLPKSINEPPGSVVTIEHLQRANMQPRAADNDTDI